MSRTGSRSRSGPGRARWPPAATTEGASYYRGQPWWAYDEMVAAAARVVAESAHPGRITAARARTQTALFFAIGGALHGGAYGWARHYASELYARLPRATKRWRARS